VRLRRLLDLDADPAAVAAVLGGDPLLGPLVAAAPGLRVPGAVDGAELAVRAVLGQQVSVAAARTAAGRLVASYGERLAQPRGAVVALFPSAATLAALDPASLPMPRARASALVGLCRALAYGELRLDPAADHDEARRSLLALPGVGPWTTGYVTMRALGDPDVFLIEDLGVRHALTRLGGPGDAREVRALAQAWAPWRSYASQYLWQAPS
jgi:AraC family transcriptional regulator, regulatory protein of adaptative response / DNA-3-methyladenine glycosylase II